MVLRSATVWPMKPLDLDSVEVRGGPLQLASHDEVDDLERDLGLELPIGYRDYVTRLGWGTLNAFVHVLLPAGIRTRLDEHRGLMAAGWYWPAAPDGVDQDWAMGSIPLADTLDGDALVIHPTRPGRIVILPRDLDRAFARDDGLLDAIEWVCSGGVLRRFGARRTFEPLAADAPSKTVDTGAPTLGTPKASAPRPATAREHLLEYFAALRRAEEAFVMASGGPDAIEADPPPLLGDDRIHEIVAQFDEVHDRFCTPSLATALRGTADGGWPVPHDPSRFEIREESAAADGRTRIRVAESLDDVMWQIVEYRLEPHGEGWRIASQRVVG